MTRNQGVRYQVNHRTTYRYSIPVSFSHHLTHLSPRPCAYQTCHRTALIVLPTPTHHAQARDYFGNPVSYITLQQQHHELILHAKSVIALRHFAVSTWIEAGLSPKTVQTFAGHSSVEVTMSRYGHLFKDAAHLEAMDRIGGGEIAFSRQLPITLSEA
jgi:Bacterial transglutaminase-like N-terminal region